MLLLGRDVDAQAYGAQLQKLDSCLSRGSIYPQNTFACARPFADGLPSSIKLNATKGQHQESAS